MYVYMQIYIYKYEYIWFFQYTYTLLVSVSNVEGVVMPSGSNAWHYWLVVNLPLWKIYEFVSWDDYIFPIYGKKCSKPPTSIYICTWSFKGTLISARANFCSRNPNLLVLHISARGTELRSLWGLFFWISDSQWKLKKCSFDLVW